MAGPPCGTCKHHLKNKPERVHLKYTLEQLTSKKGKEVPRDEFFKRINSFLNEKGGSVLIHSDKGAHIDLFDQQVDDRLLALIPDNAMYQDVYERYFLDCNHVLYRVKPRDGANRPLSVLDFGSKFSVSKGVVDPTHGQIKEFVEHIIENKQKLSQPFDVNRGAVVLEKDKPALVTRVLLPALSTGTDEKKSKPCPLRENICTQAKAYDQKTEIKKYCWEKSKPYISAFSKIPGGGSVYIGLDEEKKEGVATGQLLPEGVDVKQIRAEDIQNTISRKLSEECFWVGRTEAERPECDIFFLPVEGSSDLKVIEIKVNYYHGICFGCPNGPKLFRSKRGPTGETEPEEISVKRWLERFQGYEKLILKGGSKVTNTVFQGRRENPEQSRKPEEHQETNQPGTSGSGREHQRESRKRKTTSDPTKQESDSLSKLQKKLSTCVITTAEALNTEV